MNEKLSKDGPPVTNPQNPTFLVEKAILLCLSGVGLVALIYLAWYRLPIFLWSWANDVWWHWIPAVLAFVMLPLAPPLAVVGIIALMKVRPRTKALFWWMATSFLISVALALLILWAPLPSGSWWVTGYWWIWGGLILALSILASGARMFTVVQRVATRQERETFDHEWRFNQSDVSSPPALGIAMSGGGIRSAAFNLGVLQALHEGNILRAVDVMSAVSGGSYIMSWYLLQPFYAAKAASLNNDDFDVADIIDEMFDRNGRFQEYLGTRPEVVDTLGAGIGAVIGATFEQPLRAFSSLGEDLDQFNGGGATRRSYREGIQTLFHGHPRKDDPQKIDNAFGEGVGQRQDIFQFTNVRPVTYQELAKFSQENHLPFFIFNGAVLVDRSARHMLWPTAFELTADDLGSDVCGYHRWDVLAERKLEELRSMQAREERTPRPLGFLDRGAERRQTGRWVHMVNLAPAISGAAFGLARFDPSKKPRTMKLNTWMPFIGNVDLGYLFPRKVLDTEAPVYVSDGGHAENLGAYALIRRRCRNIVVVDAEHEDTIPYVFDGYRKLKSRLYEEESFLLQVDAIDNYLENKSSGVPPSVMAGKVTVAGSFGTDKPNISVVYIKLGLDRHCLNSFPEEVRDYAEQNPLFPQDPTTNQSFIPAQFTAYRDLGRHIGAAATASVRKLL
jgi:hypothetical protein